MLELIILIILYFLPALIAGIRGHNFASIFVLDLLLGWTILGWVIALVWSVKDQGKKAYHKPD